MLRRFETQYYDCKGFYYVDCYMYAFSHIAPNKNNKKMNLIGFAKTMLFIAVENLNSKQ